MGGVLVAFSADTGEKLIEYNLDAPPAWDSLAVASNRLFLCTTDGHVVCFHQDE
jgi:outer membrane protein assembly factor BamB